MICIRCQVNTLKPSFNFYCRRCYKYLDIVYKLNIDDYIAYFESTYRCSFNEEYCTFLRLDDIHHYFQNVLKITDKDLSEILEMILFVKVNTIKPRSAVI